MAHEIYQYDLFTGASVDVRSSRQKQRDEQQAEQLSMFATREIAQFGVKAHPLLPIADTTKLALMPEDPRTLEECERDLERAAQALTTPLFVEPPAAQHALPVALLPAWCETTLQTWSRETWRYRSEQLKARQQETQRRFAALLTAQDQPDIPQKSAVVSLDDVSDWDVQMGWFSLAELVNWQPDLAPLVARLTPDDLGIMVDLAFQRIFETYRAVFAQLVTDYVKTDLQPTTATFQAMPPPATQYLLL